MALMEIPLSAVPFQTVSAVVNGQKYSITIRQIGNSLYTSITVDGIRITSNVLAVVNGRAIPFAQPIARTELWWMDLIGVSNPHYDGLGSRWHLVFEENDE